jgi:hypothetical protein
MPMTASASTAELILARAFEAVDGTDDGAARALAALAGDDRAALEEARDRCAERLHRRSDDWEATAALSLLNRALVAYGWSDADDWKVRWSQRRKP